MAWYDYISAFFAGAFLINCVPHIVQGVSGNEFQTPFAEPRGFGESSAIVNVIWGFANLAIGGVLASVAWSGPWPPPWQLCATAFVGALVLALYLANHFRKMRHEAPHP